MKATGRPRYLVITLSAITLKCLTQTVKRLMSVKVSFEARRNKKRITQCHRCQSWRHATANCFRSHRCLKCAGNHSTKTFTKPLSVPATCVNCTGDHPANALICPAYKEKILLRDNVSTRLTKNTQRYRDAPEPVSNAWHRPICTQSNTTRQPSREINYEQNYPQLIRRKPQSRSTASKDEFLETRSLIAKLNNLINIKEVNRALKDLRAILQKSGQGRSGYYRFMRDIDTKYALCG